MTAAEFHECQVRAQGRLRTMATIAPDDPNTLGAAALGLAMIATPDLRGAVVTDERLRVTVFILRTLGIHVPLAEIEQFAAELCGPAH